MKQRICAASTVMPTERLNEVHDCLTLALDATEGTNPQFMLIREARSYVRAARKEIGKSLEEMAHAR